MKLSASLIAMSISALRACRVKDAAELFSQAAVAADAPALIASLVENNEIACSLSSAVVDSELSDVIASLSTELSNARRAGLMSDPLEDILSVADDSSDDDEDDQIDLSVANFETEDDEDEFDSFSTSSDVPRSLIKLTLSKAD